MTGPGAPSFNATQHAERGRAAVRRMVQLPLRHPLVPSSL